MKKNGFVTSALLYGILSLFIVLLLSTVAIIGNRKLASDKIKQSALDDVQNLSTNENCFKTTQIEGREGFYQIEGYEWKGPGCSRTIFIPKNPRIVEIAQNAFNPNGESNEITSVTIYGNIETINEKAFSGNSKILFTIKNKNAKLKIPDGEEIWGAANSSYRLQ